jgi:hypothetical protein
MVEGFFCADHVGGADGMIKTLLPLEVKAFPQSADINHFVPAAKMVDVC